MNIQIAPDPLFAQRLSGSLGQAFVPGDAGASAIGTVYPRTTAEVAAAVRLCAEYGIAITPQGGLTGMVGGGDPSPGCLIISTEKMREIEEIDLSASTVTVQAGVPLQRVQECADENGMLFPLDLGARGSCLIGGNIATNAGGNRVLRYGMMRDLVLGLEVVLPDGTIITSLKKMLKNNTGYDWKQLFIGSEGTLGIITRAVLRLYPKPRSSDVALCSFASFPEVLDFLRSARGTLGGDLSAFEVMWSDFYQVALDAVKAAAPLPADQPFYVLVETLGSDEDNDRARFERLLAEEVESGAVKDAVIAQSSREADRLWAIRDASGELDRVYGPAVHFDVSVPTGDIAEFVEDCRNRLREQLDGEALVFGHIADSNIHLSCKAPGAALPANAIKALVYTAVRDWGGSVSAEHGIGIEKRDYIGYSRSSAELALMARIKDSLDPANLMNPGKVLAREL